jgi:selenocysteine lyase/cysteine desulfurase
MTAWNRRTFLKTTAAAGLAASTGALPRASEAAAAPHPAEAGADDPLGIRAQFPVTRELAYLNTASMGPIPIPVHEALAAYAEERMMYRDPASRSEALGRARERFARMFGADAGEIALLYSTSDGENLVANAIDWRPGDNVVIDELHFTTAFVVFRELEKRSGIELRIVPSLDGRARPEDFEAHTDERTRLISVAWVSNRNGFRHDLPTLAEIAHARGGYLFADGIQAFGTFPTDLHAEGVDFACGNGYKWLFADFGCSPLFVREETQRGVHGRHRCV